MRSLSVPASGDNSSYQRLPLKGSTARRAPTEGMPRPPAVTNILIKPIAPNDLLRIMDDIGELEETPRHEK